MKRVNIFLLLILAAAMVLFSGYLLWIHGKLDTIGPVFSVEEGMLEISVRDPAEALLQGITAVDERDGDVTEGILVESVYGISDENLTTVTYAAVDSAGNVSKFQRQVRYTDYREPRFELYASPTFAYGSGFDLLEQVGAEDVLEGNINRRVHAPLISDTQSLAMEGNHQVKLQVTNSLGDTVEMILPVSVYNPEWYTASVTLKEYLIYLEAGEPFEPRSYLDSFVFRGNPIDLTRGVPDDITADVVSNVKTGEPGVYEVTYILSRTQNAMTHSGIAKLIVIVQ